MPCGFARPTFNYWRLHRHPHSLICAVRIRTTNFQLQNRPRKDSIAFWYRADSHDQLSITRCGQQKVERVTAPCGFARPTFNYLLRPAKSRVCNGAVRIRTTNFQLPSLQPAKSRVSYGAVRIRTTNFQLPRGGKRLLAIEDVPCGFARPTFNYHRCSQQKVERVTVPCGFARPTYNYLLQQAKSRVCYGAVRIRTTNLQLLAAANKK